ncbi:reverse transcriptase [Striga asiatica]|uniref:Reverse transcriptase n=1 Tax=Striga asiatica TaxID=4170 RepID=A0A5A7RDM3_STRAF|nr:reverse transcriptase [Striga asiatica]
MGYSQRMRFATRRLVVDGVVFCSRDVFEGWIAVVTRSFTVYGVGLAAAGSHQNKRRKKNAISRVVDNTNRTAVSQEQNETCFFYQSLFTYEGSRGEEEILHLISPVISEEVNSRLIATVDEAEIKATLFSMNPNKAPGEDGMTLLFFQHLAPY